MKTAPHTYINGELVWAKDAPIEDIRNDPYILEGAQGLPTRIWWNNKPVDILDHAHDVWVQAHQLGSALGIDRLLSRVRLNNKAKSACGDLKVWVMVTVPHSRFEESHPFDLGVRSQTKLVRVRYLSALLDHFPDIAAWRFAAHVREIYPMSEALPIEGLPVPREPEGWEAQAVVSLPPVAKPIAAPRVAAKTEDEAPRPDPTPPGGAGAAVSPAANADGEERDLADMAGAALFDFVRAVVDGVHPDLQLAGAFETAMQHITELRGDADTLQREMRAVQADNARLKADNTRLEERLAQLEAFVNALKGLGGGRAA